MAPIPPDRHLLRARDLIDARYAEPLDVAALARAACVSRWHFIRTFRRAFGETPHQYLLSRRLERAAALLRATDHPVAEVCAEVGWRSVGSFTSRFTAVYGESPAAYRRRHPEPAALAPVPTCVLMAWTRPCDRATSEKPAPRAAGSVGPDTVDGEGRSQCSHESRT